MLFKKQFPTLLNSKASMKTRPWNMKLHYNIFYANWNKKNFFSGIEYDKLHPSGSAPACISGTPKMRKFSSSDTFSKLHPIVLFIVTFNYNLAHFLCDILSSLVPNYYSSKDKLRMLSFSN